MTCCCSPFLYCFWMISLVRGSSNAPRKTIPPHCCQHVCLLRTWPWEWLLLIPQPVCAGGWSVQLVGTLVFPWLSYHGVLLLTPVLCHLRGPQITCCSVPLSPLHTNSSTLSLSLSLLVSLSGASRYTQLSAPTGHGTVDM